MLLLRSLPKKTKYRHGKTTYRHAKTWRYIVYDIISQEMEGIRMITYKVYSDIGNREKNEDSVGNFHVNQRDIFVLADGLGGHGRGEVASSKAIETARDLTQLVGDSNADLLSDIFEEAQKRVMNIQEGTFANGMKTTLVALDICRDQIKWAHIGDSRLYYFQNCKLVERTLDHSVPQMLVLAHKLKEKKIRRHILFYRYLFINTVIIAYICYRKSSIPYCFTNNIFSSNNSSWS